MRIGEAHDCCCYRHWPTQPRGASQPMGTLGAVLGCISSKREFRLPVPSGHAIFFRQVTRECNSRLIAESPWPLRGIRGVPPEDTCSRRSCTAYAFWTNKRSRVCNAVLLALHVCRDEQCRAACIHRVRQEAVLGRTRSPSLTLGHNRVPLPARATWMNSTVQW